MPPFYIKKRKLHEAKFLCTIRLTIVLGHRYNSKRELTMEIRINTSDGTPIYSQIVSQVKYLIASGRLSAGEQLPPVRKLAEQLTVNPNTVARAYRELETEKAIVSRRGSGVFVDGSESPLAKREKTKVLSERIDALLAEAEILQVDFDTLDQLIERRKRLIKKNHAGGKE